jgi:hypothetical protein
LLIRTFLSRNPGGKEHRCGARPNMTTPLDGG